MITTPIYLPREDTYLLESAVKRFAYGKTLEMGTGSGHLSKIASDKNEVKSVLAVDINPNAIEYAKKNNYNKKIKYLESNLFSKVKGSYDTIFFNPPYLPDHPDYKDVALDGGKKGYELPVKFLIDAKKHLKINGQILFLFSSLTQKNVIEQTLIENNYSFEKIEETSFDYEKLYVYKLTNIEAMIKDVTNLSFFSKGKRGLIYTAKLGKIKVGIKIKNPTSTTFGRIFIEGQNLKKANELDIGPELIKFTNEYVIYKFIEGVRFEEYLETSTKPITKKIIKDLFSQMRTLDKNKINKEEMTNPYKHILITKNIKPILIDFERANYSSEPHNINQFCQYITTERVMNKLLKKGIIYDKSLLFRLAQNYKKDYSEIKYKKLIDLFK